MKRSSRPRIASFRCARCTRERTATASRIRRAEKIGAPLYCGRKCAGLARRTGKTVAERKAEKAAYDAIYQASHRERRKAQSATWYKANHDREKERAIRAKRMPLHVEYCRQPAYRAKKQTYDERRRSRMYGEFAECHRLLVELKKEIVARVPNYYERHTETIKDRAARWKARKKEEGA